MTERFLEHADDLEKTFGIVCPYPRVLFMPWVALRVFLKRILEHRHLHFLLDCHNILGATYLIPLPMQVTYVVTNCQENVEHVLKSNFANYVKGDDFFIPR